MWNTFGVNTLGLDLTLTRDQTILCSSGSLYLAGSINNAGYTPTLSTSTYLVFTGPTITGSGGLTVAGNGFSGSVFLEDRTPDSYTGPTTIVSAGVLYLAGAKGNAIVGPIVAGDGPGPAENDCVHLEGNNEVPGNITVTVKQDGFFDLDGFSTSIDNLTMTGGNVSTGTGTLMVNGSITSNANVPSGKWAATSAVIDGNLALTGSSPETFTVASGNVPGGTDLDVKASISGNSGIELIGSGTMHLGADNSYTGPTLVSSGNLIAGSSNALGNGAVRVNSGATLDYNTASSGTLSIGGNLTNDGAVILNGGSTGNLTVGGNYSQAAGATLQLALASSSAFDQLSVAGTAALAGTLTVNGQSGFAPAPGNQFKIMTFASSSGTFGNVNLTHSSVLALKYYTNNLTVADTSSKGGGSGPPKGAFVWTGAGPDANWSDPQNWAGGVAPGTGATLYFPTTTALNSVNNYTAESFGSLILAGSGYQISGNPITLANGLTAENSSGGNTVSVPLTLSAAETITDANPGTNLVLTGSINNGGNLLTVDASGSVQFTGPAISGAGGLTMQGNGTFLLADTAGDTYTGPTTVQSGTLAITNAAALSAATTVTGGTLLLQRVTVSNADSLTLNGMGVNGAGALQAAGGSDTWNGMITLNSNTAIGTAAGTTLRIVQIPGRPKSATASLRGRSPATSRTSAAAPWYWTVMTLTWVSQRSPAVSWP